ncbi:type II secretion system minor pseudopilin GspI [Teredinibacter turnerae]|uniref:type II secretion system minor pseudopilin GspI n=1 Tax=Teredinibacter turnerae TaxID=2426 RepID=UPI000372E5B2|nr:type II secretion system minor pseudopilin GspI [Teredinibacter turnerae]
MLQANRGFTLIEAMIALVIVGVTLVALVERVQSVSDNTGNIEEKTFAYWIAQNKLEEIFLDYRLKKTFPRTEQHDKEEYAGKDWYWEVKPEVRPTALGNMYRLEVRVGNAEDDILASVAGLLHEEKQQQTVQQQP